ncbi:unnamed protein product [Blepharisma stoltei]|uniref:Uncharacterized protein n=1 Tax=Blepharisma stoltei TaxID=1481888 RepID=A0AAU9JAS1_9CILI|nr:unnamed protein product [Blepharisma stoltei]
MSNQTQQTDFVPKRYGLQYSPPSITLEYFVPSKKKLYHHKMELRELDPAHDPADWLDYLRQNHGLYIDPRIVDESQLINLIEHLQSQISYGGIDFNNLSPEEIEEYKRQVDEMNNYGQNENYYLYGNQEEYSDEEEASDLEIDFDFKLK